MTPDQVSSALRQADTGLMWPLIDLANDARHKDCHLQSILGTREMSLTSLGWEIFVPEGAKRKERKVADWLREALACADGSDGYEDEQQVVSLRGLLKHMQTSIYHGYAVAETLYVKSEGKLWPSGWKRTRQRRFRFGEADGRLYFYDELGGMKLPGLDVKRDFPRGKLVVHMPCMVGDEPQREGLSRVLLWAALFRNWDLRDWVALGELAWKPWRLGEYSKQADEDDVSSLKDMLRRLTSSGVGVYPDTTKVHIQWPEGNKVGASHSELFAVLGAEMSKAVLGQTLTTEQGSRGSQALGNVHDNVRGDILESDAADVSETIRRDLIAPLVRMNFGRDAFVPGFRLLTDESQDLAKFATGIKTLREAGLRIPASYVRDQAGIPEPKEGEELLGDGEVDIPIDQATGLPAEPGEPPEPPEPNDESPGEDDEEAPQAPPGEPDL